MDKRNSKESMLQKIAELEYELSIKPSKEERVFMQCLPMVLEHCGNWTIGDKKINDAKGYCTLAKIFTKESIKCF